MDLFINIKTKPWPLAAWPLQHNAMSWISSFVWITVSGLHFEFSEDKWDERRRACAEQVPAMLQLTPSGKSVLVSVQQLKVLLLHWKYIDSQNVTSPAFFNSAHHIQCRLECSIYQRLIAYYLRWRRNNSSPDYDCAKPLEQCYAGSVSTN